MPAGFLDLKVAARENQLHVSFRLENRSRREWTPADEFAVGWQVYDPESSAFLMEGEWQPLRTPLKPGESAPMAVDVDLPREDGGYRVFLSPRSKTDGWHYHAEWPFVNIESLVEAGAIQSHTEEVTTVSRLRRRGLPRAAKRLVTGPVETVWRNRRLIASMVRRDLAARYRGSLGDAAWALLHPLLLMVTYFFVFGIVLQARFGGDTSRSGFVLYFLAGMLPWLPFAEAVGRAPGAMIEHRGFVKKLLFPVETIPVNLTAAGLITGLFALGVFLLLYGVTKGWPGASLVWLPAIVAPQILLTLGVCWFCAAIGVFLRDLGQIVGFALTLVFFLTPICYPESQLPAWAGRVLQFNPMLQLVRAYRAVLLEQRAPDWGALALLMAFSLGCALWGYAVFRRLQRAFADAI